MSQSRSDKPTTHKSRFASDAENARSAADVTDERYVWSNKVFQVFSIPNTEADPWYIRLDVSMLPKDDYILYVENSALFPTEMPFQIFPPNFQSGETPEEGNPLIISSRFEFGDDPPGNMIQIPPHSQLNITMRLRKDCHIRQDFRVTVYRHYGRTRDSDFRKDKPLSREFFQIPEADTCAVDIEVLTREAHFRPWNLAARRSHFFWKLAFFGRPLFNRPQLLVQAQNLGSLPVNAQAHLYKIIGQDKKAFGVAAPEETLAPGQECVWTFPLWLRDPKEADEVVFASSVEIKKGGHKLKDIEAGDKVIPEYHPYRSLPKDLLALFGILGLIGCSLVWALWGIPVKVTPQVGVCFVYDGQKTPCELPKDVSISDFAIVEMNDDNTPLVVNGSQPKQYRFQDTPLPVPTTRQDGTTGTERVYISLPPARLMGYRWPFGWNGPLTRERHFSMVLNESSKFKAGKDYESDQNNLDILETPTLNYHTFIRRNAVLIHNFAIRRKDHKYLKVDCALNDKAKEANKIDIKLEVLGADNEPPPVTKPSFVSEGKASANFDITNYVSAGNRVSMVITATTNNHYVGTISKGDVDPTAHFTTITLDKFKPDSEQTPATPAPSGITQPPRINQPGVAANPGTGTKKPVAPGGSQSPRANPPGIAANPGTGTNPGSTDTGQANPPGQLPPSKSGDDSQGTSSDATSAPEAPDAKVGQTILPRPKGDIHLPSTGTEPSGTAAAGPQPKPLKPPSAISPGTPAVASDTKSSSFSADELLALDTPDTIAQAGAKADAMLQMNLTPDQKAAALAVKGMVYLRNDNVPEAKNQIDQALNIPGNPLTGHGRALAYLAQAHLDKVNDSLNQTQISGDFDKATTADPKLALAWSDKARYNFDIGNKQQAEEAYASGNKHNPHSALFHYCFMLVFHDSGESAKAQAQKQLMLRAESDSKRKRVLQSNVDRAKTSVYKRFSAKERENIAIELEKSGARAAADAQQKVPVTAQAGTSAAIKQQNIQSHLSARLTRQYFSQVRARYHLTPEEALIINREAVTKAVKNHQ